MKQRPAMRESNGQAGRRLALPLAVVGLWMVLIDLVGVASALPAIAADLGGLQRLFWVMAAYLGASALAVLASLQVRAALGHKRFTLVALGAVLAGCLLGVCARTMETLALARALQGAGGGSMLGMVPILLAERAGQRRYLPASIAVMSAFAVLAGGLAAGLFGWRAVFVLNVPLIVAGALCVLFPGRGAVVSGASYRLDWAGGLLLGIVAASAFLALDAAQAMRPGVLPVLLVFIGAAIAAVVALLDHERKAEVPLIAPAQLRQAMFQYETASLVCAAVLLLSLLMLLPVYLRVWARATPFEIALLLLALLLSCGAGAAVGRFGGAGGRTDGYAVPVLGLAFTAAALTVLAARTGPMSARELLMLLSVIGLFIGMGHSRVAIPFSSSSPGALREFIGLVAAGIAVAIVGVIFFATLAVCGPECTTLLQASLQAEASGFGAPAAAPAQAAVMQIAGPFRASLLALAGLAGCGAAILWIAGRHNGGESR